MRAQHQKFKHDPDNDIFGDCHRTAIAMLLDMDRDLVPHFGFRARGDIEFHDRVDDWLESIGMTQISVCCTGNLSQDSVLDHVDAMNGPGLVFLLGGKSPRGDFNHTVVAGDGRMLLDPHPSGDGLAGPCVPSDLWWITFVVKKDFVRRPNIGAIQLALPLGL